MGKKIIKLTALFFLFVFYFGCNQNSVAVNPGKTANPHFNRGMMYKAQKQFDLAEIAFKEAIRLDPNNKLIHEELRSLEDKKKRESSDSYKIFKTFTDPDEAYAEKESVTHYEESLFEELNIFKPTFMPLFEMKIAKGLQFDKNVESGISNNDITIRSYGFVNKQESYMIIVLLIKISEKFRKKALPQPWEEYLGYELHGNAVFYTGVTVRTKENERGVSHIPVFSEKNWMYSSSVAPIGEGKTRVLIKYMEPFEQIEDKQGFIDRANSRVDFSMKHIPGG